jgi:hypothetical protein
MSEEEKTNRKPPVDSFAEMFKSFGLAVGQIFDDPDLKKKAREFAESAADSAKTMAHRFTDEDVKAKFRDVGKAAEEFGKSVKTLSRNKIEYQDEIVFCPLFSLMGALFCWSAPFWRPISQSLLATQEQTNMAVPSFWDLAVVLTFVRVIFIIVGIFLVAFGCGVLWLKKR